MVTVTVMSSAPDSAHAFGGAGLLAALRGDTTDADGYQVLGARKLYRTQDRPWAQIPTGAKLLVRTPAGVTLADVHRMATQATSDERSPLAVPGVKVEVLRAGDLYELHVTHSVRSQALEIQHRASRL